MFQVGGTSFGLFNFAHSFLLDFCIVSGSEKKIRGINLYTVCANHVFSSPEVSCFEIVINFKFSCIILTVFKSWRILKRYSWSSIMEERLEFITKQSTVIFLTFGKLNF
jgi:hypothetical protein